MLCFEKRKPGARSGKRTTFFRITASVAFIVLLLLATLLVSCDESQPAQSVIKIGLVSTLSGPYGIKSGIPTLRAAQMAVDKLNSSGGLTVNGRKMRVELIAEDDEDNPEKSVIAAYKLINQMEVSALVAPHMSRNAIPLVQIAEMARVPTISPASTHEDTTKGKKYIFRACFVDTFQGEALARFARRDLKADTAAILFDEASAYNRGLAEVFRRAFENDGGRIISYEKYVTGRGDFRPLLRRIRENRPQVLFMPNYIVETVTQARQARQCGIKAVFLGSDTWDGLRTYPDELEGAYFADHWHASLVEHGDNHDAKAFVKAFREKFNTEPSVTAAFTYDTIGLLAEAIQYKGAADSESIRAGLMEMASYEGVTGSIDFVTGGDPERNAVIMHIDGGRAVFECELGRYPRK